MWVEIICGLVIYRLFRRFFYDDDLLDLEASDSSALFSVATRLEKMYGGKAYVGLRIPDPDTATRQNIDIVLLTKGEAVVISVKNFSGFATIDADGSWVCSLDGKRETQRYHDPVLEVKNQVSILEAYLEQRGIPLPQGYISSKVVLSNPKFCILNSGCFPPEVMTYEQWAKSKPEARTALTGWVMGAFRFGKKEIRESLHQQLNFGLSTAPAWDRLELKGNKYVLGEFLEFKGKSEDMQALRNVRRSKVSRLVVQRTSMFGLAPSRLQVLYSSRDYRNEGGSDSEWREVTVRSSTEILFQPLNPTKICKFKLSSVVSMTLSA